MSDVESKKPNLLPDFHLAPLKTFSLDVFTHKGNRKVAQLMLTFAYIHNDLKDMLYFLQMIETNIQQEIKMIGPDGKNARMGQLAGMKEHCARIISGCIWEFVRLIEENLLIINSPEFDTLIQCSNRQIYQAWLDILSLIKEKREVYQVLVILRNNATYHYYNTNFTSKGIEEYKTLVDDIGFISLGNSLEETRFYFADAAVQYFHRSLTKDFSSEMNSLLEKILMCLMAIVKNWFTTTSPILLNDYK
jgi:hypothetical protein